MKSRDFLDVCRLSHEMDIIHRKSAFMAAKFKEVNHGVDPTFFDVWVFAEVVAGVEKGAGVYS